MLLGVLVALEKRRYTPLYEDVRLVHTGTSFRSVRLNPLGVDLEVYVDITNPNPYELFVLSGGHGKAVVGSQMMELGTVVVIDAIVPARRSNDAPPAVGEAVLTARLEADIWETLRAAATILQGPFTVYFELLVDISVEPDVMGVRVAHLGESVQEFCGLQVQLLPDQVAGDVVCGSSFSSLEVPPLFDEDPDPVVTDPSASNGSSTTESAGGAALSEEGFAPPIDKAIISEAEELRDLVSGVAMSVSFSLAGLLLLFVLSLALCAGLPAQKAPAYSSSAPVEKIGHSLEEPETD